MRAFAFALASLVISVMSYATVNPLSVAPPSTSAPAGTPSYVSLSDSLIKVLQTSGVIPSSQGVLVYGAENQMLSIQAFVTAPAGGLPSFTMSLSSLTQVGGNFVIGSTATDIVNYAEDYVSQSTKTATGITYFNATGNFPDILVPTIDPYYHQTSTAFPTIVIAGQNKGAWFDVHVPSAAPSGWYSGTVVFTSGAAIIANLPVTLGVWGWVMPSTATLPFYTNVDDNAMCIQAYGGYNGCVNYPNASGSADAGVKWSQVDLMRQGLDNKMSISGNIYPPVTNSSNWPSFQASYGALLTGTSGYTATILPGAELTTISPFGIGALLTNTSAQAWVTEIGTTNGLFLYNVDEPSGQTEFGEVIANSTAPHSATPRLPVLCTTNLAAANSFGAQSAIDWMIPNIVSLEPVNGSGLTRSSYNSWQSTATIGVLGSYQSCSSAGTCGNGSVGPSNYTYPNVDIDGQPTANRAFEWLTFMHQQTMEVYYDTSFCWTTTCGNNGSATVWSGVYAFGGQGDGTLLYPGTSTFIGIGVTTPIWLPSIRLKHIRDGIQDFEYLHRANALGLTSVVAIATTSWITNSYTFNPSTFPANGFASNLMAQYVLLGNAIQATIFPPGPAITSPTSATGTVGTPFSYQITATGSPTSWGAANLPSGLSVNSSNGLISGTPTAVGFTVATSSATNALGTGTRPLNITINPLPTGSVNIRAR